MQNLHLFAWVLLGLAVGAGPSNCLERPLFEDVSSLIGHRHHEELFDDFDRQGLLPHRLSQLGPGISWVDLKRDGHDSLIVGCGKGGALAIFEAAGSNNFKPWSLPAFTQPVTRDRTAILGVPHADGTMGLLAGVANYEDGSVSGACVQEYNVRDGTVADRLPTQPSSVGPLALGDIDADGDLDLFVGGRVLAGRYPEPASSLIFENRAGQLILDETNSATLKNVGLVSGAVWTDLDGDGYPELVLACEWGPIRIFHNRHGRLSPTNYPLTFSRRAEDRVALPGTPGAALSQRVGTDTINYQLSTIDQLSGWWNGVGAGDFDGDGRMDLAVSNWGLNSRYQIRAGHGPRIYYGAWGGTGEVEPLEAAFDAELNKWLPLRDLNSVSRAMPWVRANFATHRVYAEAGVEAILGEHLKEAHLLEARWLETTVFLNRRDHFEMASLPACVQFSPAFGVNVADFDGDGNEDIFLSQNFFDVPLEAARQDAGRGIILRGDGRGGFSELDGSLSGIKVYGEQRGSAVADYDADGRPDLAITQNGAETKLFHNVKGRPGLRVRLKGPPGNPHGVGAIIRVFFGERWGPAREIHAGSGYWSQDSSVQVMGTPQSPTKVQVVWPGGSKNEIRVPDDAREVEVRQP